MAPIQQKIVINKDAEYVLSDNNDQDLEFREGITIVNPFDILNNELKEEGVVGKEKTGEKYIKITTNEWVQNT